MVSEKIDIVERGTQLFNAIFTVLTADLTADFTVTMPKLIEHMGILFPYQEFFTNTVKELKAKGIPFDSATQVVVIVLDEKKWFLTKIKYGY